MGIYYISGNSTDQNPRPYINPKRRAHNDKKKVLAKPSLRLLVPLHPNFNIVQQDICRIAAFCLQHSSLHIKFLYWVTLDNAQPPGTTYRLDFICFFSSAYVVSPWPTGQKFFFSLVGIMFTSSSKCPMMILISIYW